MCSAHSYLVLTGRIGDWKTLVARATKPFWRPSAESKKRFLTCVSENSHNCFLLQCVLYWGRLQEVSPASQSKLLSTITHLGEWEISPLKSHLWDTRDCPHYSEVVTRLEKLWFSGGVRTKREVKMRTRALRPVRQERNRRILGPKLTVTDRYSPLVDTRDRFGKRVGIISISRDTPPHPLSDTLLHPEIHPWYFAQKLEK